MSTSLDKKRKLKGNNMIENNQLKSIIERLERLEEDRKAVVADIGEVYLEAKGNGFDTKIIKRIIAIRKQDQKKVQEEESLLAVYMSALGMLADLPLGQAAIERERADLM